MDKGDSRRGDQAGVNAALSLARQFARWAVSLRHDELPASVRDKARAFVLHALAGAMLGARSHHARDAITHVLAEEPAPSGASLFCGAGRCSRVGAAYANAEMIHASMMFDSYRMLTHPGPIVIPAVMANADLEGRTGKDIIVAVAAGYEFMFRLCDEFIPSTAARGFRPSPIYGTMGATLASGLLMGLDEDRLVAAIALAANFTSGLNEGPRVGSGEMSLHEPQAARNAVFAAQMARMNRVRPAESVIEGESGFYAVFAGNHRGDLSYSFTGRRHCDPVSVTSGLGEQWLLLDAMFRMYPMAGYNQPVVDLVAEMLRGNGITHADIERLDVRMNWIETLYPSPAFPRASDWNRPRAGSTHQYAAYAAVNGRYPAVGEAVARLDPQSPEGAAVWKFMSDKVRLVQEVDRPMFSPAIDMTLIDGRRLSAEYPYARMAWDLAELERNLQRCVPGFPGGKAGLDRLVEQVSVLDRHGSTEPLHAATRL